ncbi:MAG: DUF5673 domain-containing protein [Lachnospiraceae bacterium]|nr:DUF5673 domain-containing protein [Lachnospiraceae bacterium]
MIEWFYILVFGTFTIWNIIKVIKSFINYIDLTKIEKTVLGVNYNKIVLILVFVIVILFFLICIKHSIYIISEMNKYDIPILMRISNSGLMLNVYLLSLALIVFWKGYKGDFLFEDGILINDKFISWEQIKSYKEIGNNKLEFKYITKKGYEQTYLIKTNKNSKELQEKLDEKMNLNRLENVE